jgi:hypothetical protein
MEGTSGAAERALLRGRAGEAALSSEGSRQRTPGGARCASGRVAGRVRTGVTNHGSDDADASGRRIVTNVRHEVPEPIGLGRSSHRERSRWEERQGEAFRFDLQPLARDISAGLRCESSACHPQLETSPKGDAPREESCTSGRLRVRCCGVRTSVVVLADRIGCRSRRAMRGRSRPGVKSVWKTTNGLAPLRESAAGVNAYRKPGRPWQSGGNGGGLSTNSGNGSRASVSRQHSSVEGISDRENRSR